MIEKALAGAPTVVPASAPQTRVASRSTPVATAPTNAQAIPPAVEPGEDYKTTRMREMAAVWKGTVLEPHTVKLLAMLMQEDGTVTAERRHDCHNGSCFAVGIQGHNICARGTPLIYQQEGKPFVKYCSWKNGKSPMQRFEEDYPAFATDWREQFREYTLRMTGCIGDGFSVNSCIQQWNSREAGRIAKVERHMDDVTAMLGY